MYLPLLFGSYLAWHYSEALTDIFRIVGNYVWFFYNMFSIGTLMRTLFSPWKRISEPKKPGFDVGEMASRYLMNFITRIIGLIIRLILIGFGVALILSTMVFGVAAFVVWLVLPFIVVFLAVFGVYELFVLIQ